MPDHLARLRSDLSGRFAPRLEDVRQLLVDARAKVAAVRPYHRLALLDALAVLDPTNGPRAWYARKLLCRLAGEPNLPAWLEHPERTRGDVVRLLIRASRVFGVRHSGGWHCSPPSQEAGR